MLDYPDKYSLQPVSFPRAENAGIITAQLELAPDADYDALKEKIGLVGNASSFMVRVSESTGEGTVVALGSEEGFYISADTESDKHLTPEGKPMPFDPRTRPWYKKAKAEGKAVFTDVYNDLYSGRMRLGCAVPYYRNKEFSGVAVLAFYLSAINDAEALADEVTKVLYETDTCFIVDGKGRLIFLKDDTRIFPEMKIGQSNMLEGNNAGLNETVKAMIAKEEGIRSVSINGKDYFIAFSPIPEIGWSSAVALDAGDITATEEAARKDVLAIAKKNVEDMDRFITRLNLFMIAAIIISILVLRKIGYNLGNRFAKPILELSDGVREIAGGNLDKKLSITTGDEIEHLANSFNSMTDELKTYIENLSRVTAEKERVAAELSVATSIQAGMLPNIFPAYPERKEFDIFASMNPAKEVGGDFYDFYLIDETHLAITIADVSGKGVPAALFMVIAKTILKNCVMMTKDVDKLAEAMEKTNDQLCQGNEESMFVTVFLGVLDITSGEFIYVNGGHNPPLMKTNGRFEYLSLKKSCMLGAMEGMTYRAQRLVMKPGDMLFLYTDGVTEAQDTDNRLYSETRLQNVLNSEADDMNAKDVLAAIRKSVEDYAGDAEQFDDITMLGLIYKG
jgi:sigma-B regulation protein RsbU (phosphoserine phosphatase)